MFCGGNWKMFCGGKWEIFVEGNGKCFKEIIFENIDHFVSYKILRKKPVPEHYNKEDKRLTVKVKTIHSERKLGQRYKVELKKLSEEELKA
jgi:hypothetical protein